MYKIENIIFRNLQFFSISSISQFEIILIRTDLDPYQSMQTHFESRRIRISNTATGICKHDAIEHYRLVAPQ